MQSRFYIIQIKQIQIQKPEKSPRIPIFNKYLDVLGPDLIHPDPDLIHADPDLIHPDPD